MELHSFQSQDTTAAGPQEHEWNEGGGGGVEELLGTAPLFVCKLVCVFFSWVVLQGKYVCFWLVTWHLFCNVYIGGKGGH